MHLEDFSPGQEHLSGPRAITLQDLEAFIRLTGDDHPIHRPTAADRDGTAASAPGAGEPGDGGSADAPSADDDGPERAVVHGTLGVALFSGFYRRMGISDESLAMLDTHWSYLAPLHVGDCLSCRVTITRVRRTSAGDRGVVSRHIELRNQDDVVVQEGTSSLMVGARGQDPLPVQWDFLGRQDLEQLGQALDQDPGFRELTAAYDGTIGLAVGGSEAHLRIYRGRVIEASRRSLLGADFVVRITERDWTRLMTAPTNEFMQMAMTGRFSSSGSGAEYLRMTRALISVIDTARTLFPKDLSR